MNPTPRDDLPAQIDERLVRRDRSPLPRDAFLRVQSINRGKNPGGNTRYYITTNGDVFESGHTADTSDWQTPFDQEWPDGPTRRLEAPTVERLRSLIAREFAAEESYQADTSIEDGAFVVVTARISATAIHEVIYEAILSPVVREILRLSYGEA